jgi:hypothetical protein
MSYFSPIWNFITILVAIIYCCLTICYLNKNYIVKEPCMTYYACKNSFIIIIVVVVVVLFLFAFFLQSNARFTIAWNHCQWLKWPLVWSPVTKRRDSWSAALRVNVGYCVCVSSGGCCTEFLAWNVWQVMKSLCPNSRALLLFMNVSTF